MGRTRPGGVVAALLVLACACSSGPERIHVRSVHVLGGDAMTGALSEAGLDRGAVEEAVRAGLSSAGFRLGDGSEAHAAGVELALRVVSGGGAGPRAEVSVDLVLRPVEEGPPRREAASASVLLSGFRAPRDAWQRALADAAQRAAEGLAIGVRAEAKKVDGLIADLGSKDARVRETAVRILGERRSREAVPALLERLGREDGRIGHRVVGALAQIGDERAVPALIELSRGADPSLTARLVPFIGDIGGAETQGYLLTLSSGHQDPRVRAAAAQALEDLATRAKDAPVAAHSARMPAP
jgi:HEAT repeat protein